MMRLGGSGIDMSNATGDLSISSPVTIEGDNQWWNVANGAP